MCLIDIFIGMLKFMTSYNAHTKPILACVVIFFQVIVWGNCNNSFVYLIMFFLLPLSFFTFYFWGNEREWWLLEFLRLAAWFSFTHMTEASSFSILCICAVVAVPLSTKMMVHWLHLCLVTWNLKVWGTELFAVGLNVTLLRIWVHLCYAIKLGGKIFWFQICVFLWLFAFNYLQSKDRDIELLWNPLGCMSLCLDHN